MREPGLVDILEAARVLIALPPAERARAFDAIIDDARAADAYRKRFGRWHPRLGNGGLGLAARARPMAAEGRVVDPAWCACLALCLTRLPAARAAVRRRGGFPP